METVLVPLNEGIVILGGARLAAESLDVTVSAVCLYEHGCWRELLSGGGEPLGHPSAEGESPFGELVRKAMAPVAACRVGAAAVGAQGRELRRASLLGAPLVAGGCFRGAVIFTAAESREYSLAEMDFVRELGSVLGGALQNTQLYDALTSQLELSHLVLRASKILTEWTDLSLTLERLTELLLLLAPGSRASVLLLDFERQELLLAASTGIAPLPCGACSLDEAPAALWKQVTAPRTVVFDYEDDSQERIITAANGFRPRSGLSVPMISRGNLIGLLLLETSGPPQGFAAAKIQALEVIADQAVTAIENARLFEAKIEAERRASGELEISQLMLTVAGAFAFEPDLARLLDTVARTMVRSFGQVRVRITLCGDRGQTRIVASAGEHADAVGTTFRIEEYSAHARRAMQTGRALAVDYDALSDAEAGVSRRMGMRAGIVAPLVVRGRAIGVLSIDEAYCRREFTARDISLAQGIANQAAIAINNAVLLEKEREAVRFAEALDEAGRLLHSTLDADTVLGRALEAGAQALGAASGVIGIAERSRWVVRYQYGFGVNIVGRTWADASVPFMAEARRRRQPVTIGDTAGDGRDLAGTTPPPGVRSVLTVPLITGEEVIGTLVYNKTEVEAFSEAEVTFATRLARSVSLALQNARLFASEHTIAETLQEALLAMPEGIPGCSIEHAYHSATVAARVGGDFYDVFELADGVIGIVIGDVSGKGLDAAVLTSAVKNSIRAQALEQTKTPAEVLRVVNDVLLRSSAPEIFASVFFGVLCVDDGRLVYCNAGHMPGLVVRRDGGVDQLPHTSPVVGAFPDMPFACAETVLEADELLFLYTDGLIEARSAGVLFGERRLFQLLADAGTREPAAAVRRVIDAVMAFTEGRLSDDMALLAVAPRGAERVPERQKLRL